MKNTYYQFGLAVALLLISYWAAPIVHYEYKIYRCASDQLERYINWSAAEARGRCHAWINGSGSSQ